MYMPPAFRDDDQQSLRATIRSARLANLVTATAEGPLATPLPLFLDENEGEHGVIHGHLAKANPQLRQAVGDTIDRYAILEPGSQAQVPFAAQVLPVVSTSRNDPCASNRCVDLIFRTENGYLPVRAHVDLTRRTVAVHGGGRRR